MGDYKNAQARQEPNESRQNAQPDLVSTHQGSQIRRRMGKQTRLKAVHPLAQNAGPVLKTAGRAVRRCGRRGGTGGQASSRAAGVILFDGKRVADQQLSWKDH
ncbi:hypothetical protein GOX01_10210 [Gluconobacter oxydans]|nr:hypothetical protein GOX01_10210 [Gluconobacter oxydans]